jgi:alpha-D-xyloside xylohydrolase
VYLPAGTSWYDFWTGAVLKGGQTLQAPAPFDSLPVYVRAGAIIPTGPAIQYVGEKPADPVTLRVYAGADGEFSLYEDDGLSYGYEKGAFARIPISWHEATRTLTIGRRAGSFPGMLAERSFQLVLVAPGRAAGYSSTPRISATVRYRGEPVVTRLDR